MAEKADVFSVAWDVFIAACATVAALVIPVGLVFDLSEGRHVGYVEWLVTAAYVVDIGVRYRRDRPEPSGSHAATGRLLDVLAALPFYPFLGPTPLQLLRLLKLYRVAGFMHGWRRRQVRNTNVLRLVFFIYWLFLSAHWITCGWVSLRDPSGAPDDGTRYLDALYWCVTTLTTVGYGDVTPENNAQTLYAIGVMILGVGVYAFIIGNIATILANIDPVRAGYLQQRERLTAFMQYRNIPRPLQQRIREYYDYLWEKRLVHDESTILNNLPPSLSTEVLLFLKRDLIGNVPLFKDAGDEFIREVALELQSVVYPPGDYIITAGQQGRDMFFISRGVVEVLSPDGATVYRTLSDGDFFGEIALFLHQPRTASVRAVDFCDLYRLDKEMFDRVLAHYPGIAAQMEARARERHRDGMSVPGE